MHSAPEDTGDRLIDQAMVDAWADLSEDWNPLHVDPVFASTSRFGSTIAHGHLSVALLVRALERQVGGHLQGGVRIAGIRFLQPVIVGRRYGVRIKPIIGRSRADTYVELALYGDADTCVTATAEWPDDAKTCEASSFEGQGGPQIGERPVLSGERPVVWSNDLEEGTVFATGQLACTAGRAGRYRRLIDGEDGAGTGTDTGVQASATDGCFPLGLSSVIARWAYLKDCSMPAGSVLLNTDLEAHRPLRVSEAVSLGAEVRSIERGAKADKVLIAARAGEPADPVLQAGILVRWPRRPVAGA